MNSLVRAVVPVVGLAPVLSLCGRASGEPTWGRGSKVAASTAQVSAERRVNPQRREGFHVTRRASRSAEDVQDGQA